MPLCAGRKRSFHLGKPSLEASQHDTAPSRDTRVYGSPHLQAVGNSATGITKTWTEELSRPQRRPHQFYILDPYLSGTRDDQVELDQVRALAFFQAEGNLHFDPIVVSGDFFIQTFRERFSHAGNTAPHHLVGFAAGQTRF